jgi:hypothetical protein
MSFGECVVGAFGALEWRLGGLAGCTRGLHDSIAIVRKSQSRFCAFFDASFASSYL